MILLRAKWRKKEHCPKQKETDENFNQNLEELRERGHQNDEGDSGENGSGDMVEAKRMQPAAAKSSPFSVESLLAASR
jgi:hypothetical protein